MRSSLKYLFFLLALLSVSALITGCGSGGRTAVRTTSPHLIIASPSRAANLKLTVRWPAKSTRLIPANTNRLVIFVNAPDVRGAMVFIVDRTSHADTANYSLNVLAGKNRTFAVEARQVDAANPAYQTPTAVAFDSPDLQQGTKLGGGIDPAPHELTEGISFSASILVGDAAMPGADTTQVSILVNQVLASSFPSVLVLQLIRDQNGDPITNFNSANFDVTEDDNPVTITDVRTIQQSSNTNIAVSLVMDRSGSMAESDGSGSTKNASLESAASSFVNLLQSGDSAEAINFSDSVSVTQGFTSDKSLLLQAIQGRSPSGGTALFDGIYRGVQDTGAFGGRSAVLALTDGIENSSSHSLSDVESFARSKGIPIFTIGLGSDADKNTLGDIASKTGGVFTFSPTGSVLNGIYTKISKQLNGQIQLSFISPDISVSGRLRHVVVKFHYGSFSGQNDYYYTQ